MFKYSMNLTWSEEDECYVATIPEFPGLSAFGDTPEEASKEAIIAAEGFMEIYKEDGMKLPKPKKLVQHSGQFRVRLPKSLHASLAKEAKSEGVSLNTYLIKILSERHVVSTLAKRLKWIEALVLSWPRSDIQVISESENTKTLGTIILQEQYSITQYEACA